MTGIQPSGANIPVDLARATGDGRRRTLAVEQRLAAAEHQPYCVVTAVGGGAVTTGSTGRWYPRAGTVLLDYVVATLATAGSSGTTVDVKVNGTTVASITVPSGAVVARLPVQDVYVPETSALTFTVAAAGTGAAGLTVEAWCRGRGAGALSLPSSSGPPEAACGLIYNGLLSTYTESPLTGTAAFSAAYLLGFATVDIANTTGGAGRCDLFAAFTVDGSTAGGRHWTFHQDIGDIITMTDVCIVPRGAVSNGYVCWNNAGLDVEVTVNATFVDVAAAAACCVPGGGA